MIKNEKRHTIRINSANKDEIYMIISILIFIKNKHAWRLIRAGNATKWKASSRSVSRIGTISRPSNGTPARDFLV